MRRQETLPSAIPEHIAFAITAPVLEEVPDSPDTMSDLPPVIVAAPAPAAKITRLVPRASMPVYKRRSLSPVATPIPRRSRSLIFRPEPPSITSLLALLIVAGLALRFVLMVIDGDVRF